MSVLKEIAGSVKQPIVGAAKSSASQAKYIPQKEVYKGTSKARSAAHDQNTLTLLKHNVKEYWPYWAGGIGLIIFIIIIVVIIKKWIKKKNEKPVVAKKPKVKLFPKSGLIKIWKKFLKRIPAEFRRSVKLYQPFIVMGDHGSGKSLVIDNYTDWQGHARQFYPSYDVDPLLQIYLGTKVVVQEIPQAVLNNTTKQMRVALIRLWKPIFKNIEPRVIVLVNATSLETDSPDSLRKLAQTIRGKINILSNIQKKPVHITVVLSFMDQIDGYKSFYNFLNKNKIPLKIDIKEKNDFGDIKTALEPYEQYLTLALTTLSSKEYFDIITFLNHAPELFEELYRFFNVLTKNDPLSITPEIERLSLTTISDSEDYISDPFEPTEATKKLDVKIDPLKSHKIAAIIIVILGFSYFTFTLIYDNYLFHGVKAKLDLYHDWKAKDVDLSTKILHQRCLDIDALEKKLKKLIFPYFQESRMPIILKDIHDKIMAGILLPKLKKYERVNDKKNSLFVLSLLYSNKKNDVGSFVKAHIAEISKNLNISKEIIRYFVKSNTYSSSQEFLPFDIPKLSSLCSIHIAHPPIIVFLNSVKNILKRGYLSQDELEILKTEAKEILTALTEFREFETAINIAKLISKHEHLNTGKGLLDEKLHKDDATHLTNFLHIIESTHLTYPDVSFLDFYRFLESIKSMSTDTFTNNKKVFRIYYKNVVYKFKDSDWANLINKSSLMLFVNAFVDDKKNNIANLFFLYKNDFPDIILNSTNNGKLFFTGQGYVKGIFTKNAFDINLKPALEQFGQILNNLPLKRVKKKLFFEFISSELREYGAVYAKAYEDFYKDFDINADSLEALKIILNDIQQPLSQFQSFLLRIKKNTNFNTSDDSNTGKSSDPDQSEPNKTTKKVNLMDKILLNTFADSFNEFSFLNLIFKDEKGRYPEFEKYLGILKQMQSDLEGTGHKKGGNNKKENKQKTSSDAKSPKDLAAQLSPAGKLALSIYLDEEGSYFNLIESWLQSVGVAPKWRYLFLEPAHQVFLLGLPEIQTILDKAWKHLYYKYVLIFNEKFPFKITSKNEVTFQELNDLLHPDKIFWTTFNKQIAPLCIKKGNYWYPRSFFMGSLNFPKDMLKVIKNMSILKDKLWDIKGNPQPINLQIQAQLLPSITTGDSILALSYLSSGNSVVYGFNQKPSWQNLQIEWWKEEISSVGVEFVTKSKYQKSYKTITAEKSIWSLFNLFLKSNIIDNRVFIWSVPGLDEMQSTPDSEINVKFESKTVPWELFIMKD